MRQQVADHAPHRFHRGRWLSDLPHQRPGASSWIAAMLFGFEAKPILKVEDEQTPAKLLAANFGAPVRRVGE